MSTIITIRKVSLGMNLDCTTFNKSNNTKIISHYAVNYKLIVYMIYIMYVNKRYGYTTHTFSRSMLNSPTL